MKFEYDVIIIGAGLAGLTASMHLRIAGIQVLVIEKSKFPRHKVCGEYVSNEVLPYLKNLGISPEVHGAVSIKKLVFSTTNGHSVESKLSLGGFGMSRYTFDQMLYERALQIGVHFIFDTATFVDFENDRFEVLTGYHGLYQSKFVIGAWGKRSLLDKRMDRSFIEKKSGWMAVKAHYRWRDFPDDKVALHNFPGGYGGLSKTENGSVNFCYLASYDSFQKERNIDSFNANVVSQNPHLKQFFDAAKPLFKKPLSIAQISFQSKSPVFNHIFMCGDSATLIHPLCGNGMAMAIHSAKLASEQILEAFSDTSCSRDQVEKKYSKAWRKVFQNRIWWGSQFQKLLLSPQLSNKVMKLISRSPGLFNLMVQRTHGKPIV